MTRALLAVCLHDVEHQTLDRCQEIRHWLFDRGVQSTTLLVIPSGRDGVHPPRRRLRDLAPRPTGRW